MDKINAKFRIGQEVYEIPKIRDDLTQDQVCRMLCYPMADTDKGIVMKIIEDDNGVSYRLKRGYVPTTVVKKESELIGNRDEYELCRYRKLRDIFRKSRSMDSMFWLGVVDEIITGLEEKEKLNDE